MTRLTTLVGMVFVLAGGLSADRPPATRPAEAVETSDARFVFDDGHLFGRPAADAAEAAVGQMERAFGKQLIVETYAAVPAGQEAAAAADRAGFFRGWMAARAAERKANGVFVLICTDPRYVEVGAGRQTVARGIFTGDDVRRLRTQLQRDLHAGQYDRALAGAVDAVARTYADRLGGGGW